MTDQQKAEQDLIKKMGNKVICDMHGKCSDAHKDFYHRAAEKMLSVVKANIGVVARACLRCYDREEYFNDEICPDCHGTGVVARKE